MTVTGEPSADSRAEVFVENFTDSAESVVFHDILTDVVSYWYARGVPLGKVRFSQWDSSRGDLPPMCHGSVFPQPAFCAEGWLAWDTAWVKKSLRKGMLVTLMYASRAVSDAVAHERGGAEGDLPSISAQECLTGAYMSDRRDSTSPRLRAMLTDVSAFVKGLESRNPMQDCISL